MVKIVNAQPGTTAAGTVYYTPPSDNFLVLSILLTVVCGICGSWIGMCCTVPAIIFAVHVSSTFLCINYNACKFCESEIILNCTFDY